MNRFKWLILFCTLCFAFFSAKAANNSPKLQVIITIQDFNQHYFSQFFDGFSNDGFKKLCQGTYYQDIEFTYLNTDYTTDIATLMTGTNPCFHGVTGKYVFSPIDYKYINILTDKETKGLNDGYQLSGRNIHSITIADRLYEDSYGMAKIVSVATDPVVAMTMCGHSGLPIYMNNLTGEWSTSQYYTTAMPVWLSEYNTTKPIESYLDRNWENMYPTAFYVSTGNKPVMGFNYGIREVCNGLKMYDNFITTPYCNDYICDLALTALSKEKMGEDLTTDLLMVNFSLSKFYMLNSSAVSIETEDAYLRLDQTIRRLIENVINKVGRENVSIALFGARTGDKDNTKPMNPRVSYESFNIDKYSALLNSYLMAFFGQKKWVVSCGNGNIYLNHDEITKAGLHLSDVQKKAKEFFYLIPGVQNLCTAEDMEEAFYSTGTLRYAYYRGISGDLMYSLMPRWYEVDLKDNTTGYFSSYTTTIPMYVYGGSFTKETKNAIKATDVSGILY